MLESDAPDRAIEAACQRAGVEFHSVTERFRRACNSRTLYFEFDGHFNPEGQALFGRAVAEFLLQKGDLEARGTHHKPRAKPTAKK